LDEIDIKWENKAAVCVVLASGGYPENYEKNIEISGLDTVTEDEAIIFHAGTKKNENGKIVTSGGRVLVVTAISDDIKSAIDKAYKVIPKIKFDKMHYRKDIGQRALKWISKQKLPL